MALHRDDAGKVRRFLGGLVVGALIWVALLVGAVQFLRWFLH